MNTTNLFGALALDTDVEAVKDVKGTNFGVIDSGIYTMKCAMAYIYTKPNGGIGLATEFKGDGIVYKETLHLVKPNGDAFYTTKANKKMPMMGLVVADAMAQVTHDKILMTLGSETVQKKMVNVYNFDEGRDIPTEVDMIMGLVGQDMQLAILRKIENKATQASNWKPTNEQKEYNAIDTVFQVDTNLSAVEIINGAPSSQYAYWDGRNTGKTRNTFKEIKGAGGKSDNTASVASGLFAGLNS